MWFLNIIYDFYIKIIFQEKYITISNLKNILKLHKFYIKNLILNKKFNIK